MTDTPGPGYTVQDNGWSDEEWWKRRSTAGQFGVPDPDKVAAQVNEICATRIKE